MTIVMIAPELMVSIGMSAALKYPTWTVCGFGMSVYSAARPASARFKE